MNTTFATSLKVAASAAVGVVLMTSCGDKSMEPYQDAGRAGKIDKTPAQVVAFPDGFSNVASKCDGPNRVYVAYKGDSNRAALAVVKDDPRCAG